MKKHEKAFSICFYLFLIICSLYFFWFSLLALLTPPDIFPLWITTDRLPHILNLIVQSSFIFMLGKAVTSGATGFNGKLVDFILGLSFLVYIIFYPIIEIAQELLNGKQILTILSENEEIIVSLSLVLMTLVILVIVVIGKQISKLNKD